MKHPLGFRPVSLPSALWLLITMLFVLGGAAVPSGFSMIADPSGSGLGFPEGALAGAPFANYFIPGILLTVFVGFLPLIACWAVWKKPSSAFLDRLNPFPSFHWAWTLALMSGLGLIIWILVQMIMMPFFFLQLVFLVWGIFLVLLCFTPVIRSCFYRGKVGE